MNTYFVKGTYQTPAGYAYKGIQCDYFGQAWYKT